MGKVGSTHVGIHQPTCDVTHGNDDSVGAGPSCIRNVGPSAIGHRGFALVAVMLLIAVVGIVTAVVLQTTSTEIKISGNHRRAIQEFYAAEAGLAEGPVAVAKIDGSGGRVHREHGNLAGFLVDGLYCDLFRLGDGG